MTSSVKSGFSTINRLLGKRAKDGDIPVDPHSASTRGSSGGSPSSVFSKSMSQLDTSSQYNKIVPLAAMSNAPFEQTFRITVALPRDQLYVVRVGAKTRLWQILDMTCTAKQLDSSKYEFRHPADHSMVFDNESTIGEVGLNEIRLVPITEPRNTGHENNFSAAEMERMRADNRSTNAAPAMRNGHSNKSQYSSTNSLNSLDSAPYRPSSASSSHPVAPMRKKRAAPRPPSQIVIPEDAAMQQKSFHVSTPNLMQTTGLSLPQAAAATTEDPQKTPQKQNGNLRPVSMFQETTFRGSTSDLQATRGVSRTSSNASDSGNVHVPRRKKHAPAPPPRSRDAVVTPQPAPRTVTPVPREESEKADNEIIPKTIPSTAVIGTTDAFVEPVSVRQPVEAAPTKDLELEEDTNSPIYDIIQHKEPPPATTAIVTTSVPSDESTKGAPPSSGSVSDEDEGVRMNVYNLNTGKCVEAQIVPETATEEQQPHEVSMEEIPGVILEKLLQTEEQLQRLVHEAPQRTSPVVVVEDLYAEVKKPPKKLEVPNISAPVKEILETKMEEPEIKKEEPEVKGAEPEEKRAESPTWTYTLPAPVHFADGNNNSLLDADSAMKKKIEAEEEVTETFNGNVYYNYTTANDEDGESMATRSMTTTVVSDVLITPVIKERIPLLDQPLILPLHAGGHFEAPSESSDFNSSSTLTSESPNHLASHQVEEYEEGELEGGRKKLIINSDVEDGYHGPQKEIEAIFASQGLIDTLERRREKFIESELEQLVSVAEHHHQQRASADGDLGEEEDMRRRKSKSDAIAGENQEPTISASPVEDGLPSAGADYMRGGSVTDDSGKFSDFYSSTVAEEEFVEDAAMNEGLDMKGAEEESLLHGGSKGAALEEAKNSFNRQQSSELGISDASPALQSIQVMRSILMASREKEMAKEEERREGAEEPVQPAPVPAAAAVDAEPKPWKYTGPPKINLGSWSERPKVQVCLKTDSDYHHSLQKAAAGADTPTNTPTPTAESAVEKVPFVRSVELKKTPEEKAVLAPRPLSVVEPVAVTAKVQRPVSMHATRFSPTVRGFLNAKDRDRDSENEIRSTKINPVLIRSDSNVVAKANGGIAIKPELRHVEKEAVAVTPAPEETPVIFSQSTLRRTGLKERILANPAAEVVKKQQQQQQVINVKEGEVSREALRPMPVAKSSAEVKEEVVSVPPPPPPPAPKLVKAPGSLLNPLAKLATATPAAGDREAQSQKPIVRGMVAKRNPMPVEVDPRAQLLDSIRNFSFNNLRKM